MKKNLNPLMRAKRVSAILLSVAIAFSVFFAVPATAATKDYTTVRVKLSNANDGTLNLELNGSYTLQQNGATLPASIVISHTAGALKITNKANGAAVYSGTRARIVRASAQNGKPGLINMYTKPHGKNDYLGDMDIKLVDAGFQVVNILPMEHYLYGVVAHEMNNSWPIEALKAQSVAARSYAAGYSGRYTDYDVVDTTNDQVYKGFKASNQNVITAVDATRGEIAMYNGKIARCYYAASNGGQTELTANIWSEAIAYCPMKDDPYDVRNPQSPKGTIFFPKTVSESTPIDSKLESFLKVQVAPVLKGKGYSTYSDQIKIVGIDSLTGGTAKYAAPSRSYKTAKATVRVLASKGSGDGIQTSGARVGEKPTQPTFTQIGETPNGPIYRDASGNVYDHPSVQLLLQQYEARLKEWESGQTTLSESGNGANSQGSTVAVDIEFTIYDLKDKNKPYRLFTNDSLIMYYPEETEGGFDLVNVRFGHGVGMSQRGAQQMANEGKTYKDILNFYYEGISLVSSDYENPAIPTTTPTQPEATEPDPADENTQPDLEEYIDEADEVTDDDEPVEIVTPSLTSGLVSGWINGNSVKLYAEPDTGSTSLGSVKRGLTVNIIQQQDDWMLVNMIGTGTIGYLPIKDVVVSKGVGQVTADSVKMRKANASTPNITLDKGDRVSIIGRTANYYVIALTNGDKGYLPLGDVEILVKNPRATLPTNYNTGLTSAKLTIYSDRTLKTAKKTTVPTATVLKVNSKTSNGLAYNVTYNGVTGYVKKAGVTILKKGGAHPQSAKILAPYLSATQSSALISPDEMPAANDAAIDLADPGLVRQVVDLLDDQKWMQPETDSVRETDTSNEVRAAATTELPGTIQGTTINMRKEASTSSSILRQLAGGEKVTVLGQSGSFYYVRDSRGTTGYVASDYVLLDSSARVGVIRFADVNVRQNPNTTSAVIANPSKNERVTVIGSSGQFYQIRMSNGKEGYVHEDLISVQNAELPTLSGGSSTTSTSSSNAPVASGSGTTTTTSSNSASNTSSRQPIVTGTVSANVNMRKEPSTTSAVLLSIPNGARVSIISRNGKFLRVTYQNTEGYVHSDYLPSSTWKRIEGATASGSAKTTTTTANSSNASGKQGVANTGVNMRSEASSKSKRLTVVYKNEPVTILEDLGEWLKVSAKGYTGYVLSKSIDR